MFRIQRSNFAFGGFFGTAPSFPKGVIICVRVDGNLYYNQAQGNNVSEYVVNCFFNKANYNMALMQNNSIKELRRLGQPDSPMLIYDERADVGIINYPNNPSQYTITKVTEDEEDQLNYQTILEFDDVRIKDYIIRILPG